MAYFVEILKKLQGNQGKFHCIDILQVVQCNNDDLISDKCRRVALGVLGGLLRSNNDKANEM